MSKRLTPEQLANAQKFMAENHLQPTSVINGTGPLMAYWLGVANGMRPCLGQQTAQTLWQHYMEIFFENKSKRMKARRQASEAALAKKIRAKYRRETTTWRDTRANCS